MKCCRSVSNLRPPCHRLLPRQATNLHLLYSIIIPPFSNPPSPNLPLATRVAAAAARRTVSSSSSTKSLCHRIPTTTTTTRSPPTPQTVSEQEELCEVFPSSCSSSDGYSRRVALAAATLGIAAAVLFMADGKEALALGPEGPLVEEFWDNVRRYGVYILTVSTGAIYTVLQPIVELLKSPLSAILLLIILGGSFYLLTQVLSFMVGINEFSYDYAN